ncbi:TspO/MBR family protein [Ascidiaceihabitans sp.]|uniref:TspO/MBR family protein n=1 Tax=Ascidiaceihabitans sp. TaxID=1872644 RepID=UPI003298E247
MPKRNAIFVFLLTFAFVLSPFWVPGFGGFDPDRFPVPQNDPPVQPEGYAFAIWGVIYLWLLAGAAYGVWRHHNDPAWGAMRPALAVSMGVGAAWLPVAIRSPIWATVLIWVMLVSALVALWRSPRDQAVWASWPLGLYAGWLSAASFVALGLMAAGYGFTTQSTAAWVCIGLASVLAFVVQWRLARAPTYGIAVAWGLVAVAVQNDFRFDSVAILALLGAAALILPIIRACRTS